MNLLKQLEGVGGHLECYFELSANEEMVDVEQNFQGVRSNRWVRSLADFLVAVEDMFNGWLVLVYGDVKFSWQFCNDMNSTCSHQFETNLSPPQKIFWFVGLHLQQGRRNSDSGAAILCPLMCSRTELLLVMWIISFFTTRRSRQPSLFRTTFLTFRIGLVLTENWLYMKVWNWR